MSPLVYESIKASSVFVLSIIVATMARRLLSKLATRFDRDKFTLIDDLFRALQLPAVMLVMLGGTYIAAYQFKPWQSALVGGSKYFGAGVTLIIIIAASQCIALGLAWYARRQAAAYGVIAHIGLLKKISILVIWVLGTLQIMTQLNQPVGTLLASLGIASLAVGLALQDTIANLFAGFYIVADRSVRQGDYVRLDSGIEGFVETVGWRNTSIRPWNNNIVLVPNAKLVQSVITNMMLPDPVLSVSTGCAVSYESDLDRVEAVALEVARQVIASHPEADKTFDPVIRFKEFEESSVKFAVTLRAVEVGAQYILQHELIKALHRRFREEGIEMFSPVRRLAIEDMRGAEIKALTKV